ncbi:ABSCISIC ACID-INSENSITIVE 5-like protein 3 [Silene latifolia]|uniref:ABSCISIC ACID-INSENSITIVE 5-like protein 3 n=1 Tax=Silene latifolia TaxID=37657 RepID=UPI003D76C39A
MGTLVLSLEEVIQQSVEQFQSFSNLNRQLRLIIDEVLSQFGVLGISNTMGSMNLEEFLKGWTCETTQSPRIEAGNCSSLQNHNSLGISGNFSEKIDDEVWREIQQEENIKVGGIVKREPSMGEMTLEDFLTKEGAIDECPLMPFDVGAQCDTPVSGRKRNPPEKFERGSEKKLNRKIKNRESAARSRARKQAYHNELVSKVSCLEEQNMRLKKEQEMENRFFTEMPHEPRFQLRRTSSAIF